MNTPRVTVRVEGSFQIWRQCRVNAGSRQDDTKGQFANYKCKRYAKKNRERSRNELSNTFRPYGAKHFAQPPVNLKNRVYERSHVLDYLNDYEENREQGQDDHHRQQP